MLRILNEITIAFTFVILNIPLMAQWVSRYTGLMEDSQDTSYCIVVDSYGNSYVTGGSGGDFATLGYDINGNERWQTASRYHSPYGYSCAKWIDIQKPFGDKVYVTGYSQGNNYAQIITVAYWTSDGSYAWQHPHEIATYLSSFGDCIPHMVKCDNAGNVYVVGQTTGNGTHSDYVTIKYGPDGQPSSSWPDIGFGVGVRVYNGAGNGNDLAIALALSGGNVYITGRAYLGSWDNRLVTIAYSPNGDKLWESHFYDVNFDLTHQKNIIAADYTQGVYVTALADIAGGNRLFVVKYDVGSGQQLWEYVDYNGYGWGSSIDFFSRTVGKTWPHVNDIFVTGSTSGLPVTIRLDDENGSEKWRHAYQNLGRCNSLAIDASENIYVTGMVIPNDMLTIKYSSSGTMLLHPHYNGPGNGVDEAQCINVDPNGNILITGGSYGGNTGDDYCTLKYRIKDFGPMNFNNPNIKQDAGKNQPPKSFELHQNSPNPFNPTTTIQFAIPYNTNISLKIYDMLGRELQTLVNEFIQTGVYSISFDGSKLSSGVYIYKLQAGKFSEMKKMILIK